MFFNWTWNPNGAYLQHPNYQLGLLNVLFWGDSRLSCVGWLDKLNERIFYPIIKYKKKNIESK